MTREEKRAKKLARKKRRQERRATRQAKRAERRAKRAAGRKKNGSKFINLVATSFDGVLVSEVAAIKQEREPMRAEVEAEPNIKKVVANYAFSEVGKVLAKSKIPFVSNMVDTVPEVINSFKKQMRVAYDVSMANGYKGTINKELFLTVLIDSTSKRFEGIAKITDNDVLVKENVQDTKSVILKSIAGVAAGRLLRSVAFRWLPGVGATANALLNNQAVKKTAASSDEIFKKDISFTESEISWDAIPITTAEGEPDEDYDILKIKTLINLMKVDGEVSDAEQKLIKEMLKHSDLDQDDKEELEDLLDDEDEIAVDLSPYKANHDDAMALMIDLIALSKVDGNFDLAEKTLIRKTANEVGVSEAELNDLLYL
jgi:uncharacterized tellurite resistance protein B-like protein